MKNISLLAAILAVLTLTSCEKVISVNLNNTDKQYVIEGTLNNQAGSAKVLISQTKNFSDNNDFPGISGAQVTITDQNNNITTLTESTSGTYTSASLQGVPGYSYTLKVVISGKTYTSTSVMPQPVPLDSIYITEEALFGDTRKVVNVKYKDPAGKSNNYRFIQYVNGAKEKTIFVRNDELSDGRSIDIPLWVRNNDDDKDKKKIKSGDVVSVEMLCIDDNVYKYWFSLDQSATGDSNVTPANPVSNISGGVLGYFSAQTYQKKTVTVP